MLKSITVFAGSAENCPEIYKQAAENLGRTIARQGRELVYGSGYSGLMGSVARGAKAAGGRIVGINVRRFEDYPPLPGGVGTLDELMDVYALVQAGIMEKPVGLLNVNGYYDGLLSQLRRANQDGFLNDVDFRRLIAADDPETLLRLLDGETK